MQSLQISCPPSVEKTVVGLRILEAAEKVVDCGDDDLGAADKFVELIDCFSDEVISELGSSSGMAQSLCANFFAMDLIDPKARKASHQRHLGSSQSPRTCS